MRWAHYNGWLGVIGHQSLLSGAAEYARQQATILNCPYYAYDEHCLADTIIVNYDDNTPTDSYLHILKHINVRKATAILDVHSLTDIGVFSGIVDNAVAHNSSYHNELLRTFSNVLYIPLPIQCDTTKIGTSFASLSTKYSVGWWGMWRPNRGVKKLARAIKLVSNDGIDCGLIAIGARSTITPDYVSEAKQYIDGLNVVYNMDVSTRKYRDILATLSSCNLYCLPYHKDEPEQSQSYAVALLLSFGKPVIVSSDKSFDDVRKYCLTFDDTTNDLARLIRALLLDANLYIEYSKKALQYSRVCNIYQYKRKLCEFIDATR